MTGAADYLGLVRFSHSVFALPFALASAWVASGGVPDGRRLAWIVVCAVAARTSAMAYNRFVDRDVDAVNPRTRGREIPSGAVPARNALALALVAGALFVAGAWMLGPWCGWISLPVLALLLGYSHAKRFTWICHLWLGLCLAIAPLGAWLAVAGEPGPGFLVPSLLAAAVLTWVAGFDLIYACQDAEFDRAQGLASIPARFGVGRSLAISASLHLVTVAALVAFGVEAGLGAPFWVALVACAALLVWQHRIVRPSDLSRVNAAFFTANGWVGVALFAGVVTDLALRS
ncbi:4-hydroxybenzoate octaprenyltransferase [Planctomycetes bacterium Pla163]|uniref:4-hydroxybenzoate polyprenyltransferase n=1 Tax=Rohdeia mirabilis TaxID=2528008 RepID=A0A518D1J4_9BACT|nr:4-hydroxybenzoate octaprenyltransferase [Planctomycetes bacterium Pla163]